MKNLLYINALILIIALSGCNTNDKIKYLNSDYPLDIRVNDLLGRMTLEEKLGQMNLDWTAGEIDLTKAITTDGVTDKGASDKSKDSYSQLLSEIKAGKVGVTRNVEGWQDANQRQKAAEESRLKIPLFIIQNAVHSVAVDGSTIFPNNLAMAATFNSNLVKKIGEILARECRLYGYNWTFSPTVDLALDARWGRCGETFGEDPLICSDFGKAMILGLQGEKMEGTQNVAACVKHFVAGGQPLNGLNFAPIEYTERTLREQFFPPFKNCVEAGAWSVMPAHHDMGGIPCHASNWLLTDVLRNEWNFEGVVVTDWQDMERLLTLHKVAETLEDAYDLGVNAGIDIHNNGRNWIEPMTKLVNDGRISEERIDRSVKAILKAKFQLGLFENRYIENPKMSDVIANNEARDVAYQTAVQSMVLLKNKAEALPITSDKYKNIMLTGPYAHSYAILGDWIRHKDPSNMVTFIDEGLINKAPKGISINYVDCGEHYQIPENKINAAIKQSKNSDAVILVIGGSDYRAVGYEQFRTGGENHARQSIELAGNQLELAKQLFSTGKKVIVVLVNGRPLSIDYLIENAYAVIETWNAGMLAGDAIADVLYGNINPSGKLPISFPRSTGQVHIWYNHKPATFFRKYQFGETGPLFPFGYGLSYTQFEYSNFKYPKQIKADSDIEISFTLKNTGKYDGDEVALIYLNDVVSSVVTPVKKLVAYQRVSLTAGEEMQIKTKINNKHLSLLNKDMKWVVEPGAFELFIGDNEMEFEVDN